MVDKPPCALGYECLGIHACEAWSPELALQMAEYNTHVKHPQCSVCMFCPEWAAVTLCYVEFMYFRSIVLCVFPLSWTEPLVDSTRGARQFTNCKLEQGARQFGVHPLKQVTHKLVTRKC